MIYVTPHHVDIKCIIFIFFFNCILYEYMIGMTYSMAFAECSF